MKHVYSDVELAYKDGYTAGVIDGEWIGTEKTISIVAKEMTKYLECGRCPVQCEYATDDECVQKLVLWLKEVIDNEC